MTRATASRTRSSSKFGLLKIPRGMRAAWASSPGGLGIRPTERTMAVLPSPPLRLQDVERFGYLAPSVGWRSFL